VGGIKVLKKKPTVQVVGGGTLNKKVDDIGRGQKGVGRKRNEKGGTHQIFKKRRSELTRGKKGEHRFYKKKVREASIWFWTEIRRWECGF